MMMIELLLICEARYNHTCEEYSEGEKEADPFIRICPLGVRSCFYVTGKYEDMGELKENKMTRELRQLSF